MKAASRRRFAALTISLTFGASCFLYSNARLIENDSREAERAISDIHGYREADQLCSSIAIPENAKLLGKARLYNSVAIIYRFKSSSGEKVLERYFKELMTNDGWVYEDANLLSNVLQFKKSDSELGIQLNRIGSGIDFAITCSLPKQKLLNVLR